MLRLWDTRRGHREATEVRVASAPAPAAGDERVIVTSARGELSAVRDTAGNLSLRENLPPRQIRVLPRAADTVAAGWFSSDLRSLLLLRGDHVLESWNVQNGSRETASPLAWQPSTWLLSPRGGLLLLSDRSDTELWQVRPLRRMATLPRHLWIFSHMAVSSDDGLLATAGYDGHVRLFCLPQGDLVADVRGARFASNWVGFSPDRSRLAAIYGADRTMVFWDITRRPPQEVLRLSSPSLFGAQWKVNWTDESALAIKVLTSANEAVDLRLVSPPLGEIDDDEKARAGAITAPASAK
jgi:WD40 repeat protein